MVEYFYISADIPYGKQSGSILRDACVACKTMRDYQEVWLLDRQTPDKVIPLCRYALQATQ